MDGTGTAPLPVVAVGDNSTLVWGMTARERLRRIAAANGTVIDNASTGRSIVADLRFAFDPIWMSYLIARPGTTLTSGNVPILGHAADEVQRAALISAMESRRPLPDDVNMNVIAAEDEAGIFNEKLRKRERPFAQQLTPETVRAIERASYTGAYKGVTDLLTKYLWPEWAFVLTRFAAALGMTPNQVTTIGMVLCVAATIAFWHGWFWCGLAVGLLFMVLDTVDGKLARCTITSSKMGDILDHGVDLVHPPFWWWAWAEGCAHYGRPLAPETFWLVMVTVLSGYVLQRLVEGAFIARFGMHIHVWRRFDSQFRLITARRNPNMVILFASCLAARPDWGIIAVAWWTALSLLVHLVRLLQGEGALWRGQDVVSWLR